MYDPNALLEVGFEVQAEVLAKLFLSAFIESGNAAGTAEIDWF